VLFIPGVMSLLSSSLSKVDVSRWNTCEKGENPVEGMNGLAFPNLYEGCLLSDVLSGKVTLSNSNYSTQSKSHYLSTEYQLNMSFISQCWIYLLYYCKYILVVLLCTNRH